MATFVKRSVVLLLIMAAPAPAPGERAKNIILFLGDAAGIPTLNAASIYGYNKPRSLFLQSMPHIALSETSTASAWVTDSAAGMTAIVTGRKTHNGVLSESASAVRGKRDGEPLKTILEYAEERGLSTGVVTNSSAASATPAACYAHINDRKRVGEIFAQVLSPRFGDGVDVIVGTGRTEILKATESLGMNLEFALPGKGYGLHYSLDTVPRETRRAVVLFDSGDFDLGAAAQRAIDILSRNPKGFFLMVESDLHTDDIVQGLERAVAFDNVIRETARRMAKDSLILFTADHSYDFRVHDGDKAEPLLSAGEKAQPTGQVESIRFSNLRRDDDHTGEEVLVAAQGPGAEQVRGILLNTDLFHIMLAAWGWDVLTGHRNGEQPVSVPGRTVTEPLHCPARDSLLR